MDELQPLQFFSSLEDEICSPDVSTRDQGRPHSINELFFNYTFNLFTLLALEKIMNYLSIQPNNILLQSCKPLPSMFCVCVENLFPLSSRAHPSISSSKVI
jgi:hypothetical protein